MAIGEEIARRALRKPGVKRRLMGCANVVATGIGFKVKNGKRTNEPSIICSVAKKCHVTNLAGKDVIPGLIDGVYTDVVETGRIKARTNVSRVRPGRGGYSIGHKDITAGTLGCVVKKDGLRYILSNNHVLANSNEGEIGDEILYPGPHDGGTLVDQITSLAFFELIKFGTPEPPSDCPTAAFTKMVLDSVCKMIRSRVRWRPVNTRAVENLVDAAIAGPVKLEEVSNEILDIGKIKGSTEGELGLLIKKNGRTTKLTNDEILQIDVSSNVDYGGGRTALFVDQIMAGPMSAGGDSGSVVLDMDNKIVGLLFAGSEQVTIINRIQNVFMALGVTV